MKLFLKTLKPKIVNENSPVYLLIIHLIAVSSIKLPLGTSNEETFLSSKILLRYDKLWVILNLFFLFGLTMNIQGLMFSLQVNRIKKHIFFLYLLIYSPYSEVPFVHNKYWCIMEFYLLSLLNFIFFSLFLSVFIHTHMHTHTHLLSDIFSGTLC